MCLKWFMLKPGGRRKMVCEVCECSPCDCHGMSDEKNIWGMGPNTGDQRREEHGMDGQGSGCQSVPSYKMAPGGRTQDRILPEGLCGSVHHPVQAHLYHHPGRVQCPRDRV